VLICDCSVTQASSADFEQTDGVIFVVDSADVTRLDLCRRELQHVLVDDKLAGASVLILANKQDLDGAKAVEEIARLLQLNDVGAARHCHVVACSAYTGEGLQAGIDWIVDDIASRLFVLD
jgi:ADP-ribosylation factor-like protein 2